MLFTNRNFDLLLDRGLLPARDDEGEGLQEQGPGRKKKKLIRNIVQPVVSRLNQEKYERSLDNLRARGVISQGSVETLKRSGSQQFKLGV